MSTPNRICPQCGQPLAPGEAFCSNCGSRYFEPPMLEPTQLSSSSYPGASSPSQSPIAPTQPAPPPYSNQPPIAPTQPASAPYSSQPAYGGSPYGNTSYGSSGQSYAPPPPFSATPPYGGAPGIYGQQPPVQPSGFAQAPQPRRGPNVALIIGVIFLLLLLVGGGLYFFTRGKSNPATATPAATVGAPTTGTAPTATVQATVQPLFSDSFADNSKNWDTTSGSGYTRDISNNKLTLTEANHKILPESFPTGTFSDLEVTITFTLVQADQNDSAGIYVRGDSNLDHDYRVEVFGNNSYAISKEYLDSSNVGRVHTIEGPTTTSVLNAVGQQNTMTVIMKGTTLVLLLNGKVISSVTDSDYTSGQVALFVQNGDTSSGVKASFNSVAIYPAPAVLPTA